MNLRSSRILRALRRGESLAAAAWARWCLGLVGAVAVTASAVAQPMLEVAQTGPGEVQVTWPKEPAGWVLEEADVLGGPGAWNRSPAVPVAEGDLWKATLAAGGGHRFLRLRSAGPLAPTRIIETSPADGEGGVAVTRETVFRLSQPLASGAAVSPEQLAAEFGGRRLLGRVQLSSDRRTLTLFYLEPLPASARVRVTLDATGLRDEAGLELDADGDGQPGGTAVVRFDTLGLTPVAGTVVFGRVFASELRQGAGGTEINTPLAGVTITVDGREETLRTVTDAQGNFRLDPAPAGDFFVHVDGRTVGSYSPTNAYYPYVGKRWYGMAGREVDVGNIFLPRVAPGTLQTVSPTVPTVVGFPAGVVAGDPRLAEVRITVPPNALYSDAGVRGGLVGIAPVAPDRIPSPLPPGLDFPLVITVQTDGASNFDVPVPACFPNLPNPVTGEVRPAGTKSALWSFNHDIGDWEIVGPMTVSEDGRLVCTDPGVGILQPGWHGEADGCTVSGGNTRNGTPGSRTRPKPTAGQETGSDDEDADGACKNGCATTDGTEARPSTESGSVLLASGEERFDRVDLRIPGRGEIEFVLQRRYRSRLEYDGPLGHGWDFTYNEQLFAEPDGGVTRLNGAGRVDAWRPGPDGGLQAGQGQFRSLVRRPDGTFVLRSPTGFKRHYRADGRLFAHEDRHGNRMLFDYDARGNLRRVIDVFGREIEFFFVTQPDGVDRLVRVRDFAGREVKYEFDSRGDLVTVTTPVVTGTSIGNDFPGGRTERYAYSSGFAHPDLNHNLVAVTAPEEVARGGPPSRRWVYGTDSSNPLEFDRVLEEIEGGVNHTGRPAGGTTRYRLERLNAEVPPGRPDVPRGRVTITEPNGNVREVYGNERGHHLMTRVLTRGLRPGEPAYYETRSEINEDGQLVRRVHPLGNEERYVYESGRGRGGQKNVVEIRRVADPARGGGPDLVTRCTYEPLYQQLSSMTDPRGTMPGFRPALGEASAERYTTRLFYDYQETADPVPEAVEFGIDLSGVPRGLGDLNGDGRTGPAAGDLVRVVSPEVLLRAEAREAVERGSTRQPMIQEFQWNERGQLLARIDEEGNVEVYDYHPENDPDGDGRTVPATFVPLSTRSWGHERRAVLDARTSPRRRSTRAPAALETLYRYDRVGHVTGVRNPRGVWTELEVTALDEIVAVVRGADVATARATGQLLGDEAALRLRLHFHHDHNGRVVRREVENRGGTVEGVGDYLEETLERDILGRAIRTTAEIGAGVVRVRERYYDSLGLPVREVLPEGNENRYEHDERNLLFRWTFGFGTPEAAGGQVDHDANGNVVRRVDAADHDGDGLPESTVSRFDGFDRPTARVDALGGRVEFDYDPASALVGRRYFGHPAARPDLPPVLLKEHRLAVDEALRVFETAERLFMAGALAPARTPVLQDADGDGWVATRSEYDARSRLTFVTRDDGRTDGRVYDGAGRVVETFDAAGNRRRLDRDAVGNVVALTEVEVASGAEVPPQSFRTLYVYDQLDRLVLVTDALGQTTRLAYDSRDNPIFRSDPEGPPVEDPLGLFPGPGQSGVINGPGNTRHWVYDGLGRMIREVVDLRVGGTGAGGLDTGNLANPDGRITVAYEYDRNSRLVGLVDDRGNRTRFGHDALNRQVRRVESDGSEWVRTLDGDGNLRVLRDPDGNVLTWTHDALNRVTALSVQRGPGVGGTVGESFAYDGLSRLVQAKDDNGGVHPTEVRWVHDSLDRVIEEQQDGGAVSSRWSGDGRRLGLVYPSGRSLGFGHDALHRVQMIREGQGEIARMAWTGPHLRELARVQANGTIRSFLSEDGAAVSGYDAGRRMVRLRHLLAGGGVLVDRVYEHNRAGYRLSEERREDGLLQDLSTLDSAYRLVLSGFDQGGLAGAPRRPVAFRAYRLDGVGNRQAEVDTPRDGGNPTTTPYGVDALNQYTQVGPAVVTHTRNGNLSNDGSRRYEYDALNRLVAVRSAATGAEVARYSYFADGRRARKVVATPGGSRVTDFRYDHWRVCEENEATTGATLLSYVWGEAGMDDLIAGWRTAAHPAGTGVFFAHQNDRGDVVALTGADGTPVEAVLYDDFGGSVVEPAAGGSTVESTADNPYRFQGARRDAETGLYYFRNRYYDPRTGRFLQRDPEWDPVNLAQAYNFPGHNPVSHRDPLGLSAVCTVAKAGVDIANNFLDLKGQVESGAAAMTQAGSTAPATGSFEPTGPASAAVAKGLTDAAGMVLTAGATAKQLQAADLAATAARGADAFAAGVRGVPGSTYSGWKALKEAQKGASAVADTLDKVGTGVGLAGNVVDAVQTHMKKAEINQESAQVQDSNVRSYHGQLDEVARLRDQFKKDFQCGRISRQEYVRKLEMLLRVSRQAGEAFAESEAGRDQSTRAAHSQNAVESSLGSAPGGSIGVAVGKWLGSLFGD